MPEYEFSCESCGRFELRRAAADSGCGATCPTCGEPARRVFAVPGLTRTPAGLRRALAAEERSANEPQVTTKRAGRLRPHRHGASPPWLLGH